MKSRISLITLFLNLSLGVFLHKASYAAAANSCSHAKSNVVSQISSKGAFIKSVQELNDSDDSNPFPNGTRLDISIHGDRRLIPATAFAAAESIYKSPKLMESWVKSIMKACPQYSSMQIGFYFAPGDPFIMYRYRDGSIRNRVCLDEPPYTGIWGAGFCG